MADADSIAFAAAAGREGLECVLVGGNAVNLYASHRTTFDVDLLIREGDAARWTSFFEQRGYRIFHGTRNFIRMHFAADPVKALPVDLMLADERTFAKIHAESERREVSAGIELAIPNPLHLIAMKLHALKSQARIARGADFQDVLHLIRTAKINVHSPEFKEVLTRYASETIRAKLVSELADAGQ